MNMKLEAMKNGIELPEFTSKLPKVAVASAISGLIVAALILMTPNPWFESFIVETGLPSVIGAAEPPLGARARIVFALVAALLVTTIAWVALKFITDRRFRQPVSQPVSVYDFDDEPTLEAPRRRRADAHPDHPPRPPIRAGDDLGTPLDLVDVMVDEPSGVVGEAGAEFAVDEAVNESNREDAWSEPPVTEVDAPVGDLHEFDTDADRNSVDEAHGFAPAEIEEPTEPSRPYSEPFHGAAEEVHVDQEPDATFEVEAGPEAGDDEPIFTVPLRPRAASPAEEMAEDLPEAYDEVESEQSAFRPEPAGPNEPAFEAPIQQTAAPANDIGALIDRLEAGIDRRRARVRAAAERAESSEKDMDSALREALDALHKVTAKRA